MESNSQVPIAKISDARRNEIKSQYEINEYPWKRLFVPKIEMTHS